MTARGEWTWMSAAVGIALSTALWQPARAEEAAANPAAARGAAESPPAGEGDAGSRPSSESQHPGDRHVHQAYALSSRAEKVADFTKIITLCQEGVRSGVSPKTGAYTRKLISWAYNKRGEALARQGHDTIALADFEAAIQNDKTRWRAFHNRGVSLAMLGRYRNAIADFNRTVELNPQYANGYFNRAEVRYQLGELEGAIDDYSRAIKLEPSDVTFYNSRGHTYYRLARYREAAGDFTVAIRLDPHNAEALTNRGDLYTALGYYERAVRDYQEAVRSNSDFARAYLSSAWLMATCPSARYRSVEGALDAMENAAKLGMEKDLRYLDTLAAVQANAGDFEAAQLTLHRAVKLASGPAADRYVAKMKQYAHGQPLRIEPQPLGSSEAQIAVKPEPGRAVQSSYDSPPGTR